MKDQINNASVEEILRYADWLSTPIGNCYRNDMIYGWAKFRGYEFTPMTTCHCGNLKTLSGLQCSLCSSWTRFHN